MNDRAAVVLVTGTGRSLTLPQVPETLIRRRGVDDERLEFVAHLDDRLGDGSTPTVDILEALEDDGAELVRLRWGGRTFPIDVATLEITETAFGPQLDPVAATVRVVLDIDGKEDRRLTVDVDGERWQQVADLARHGPHDRVFEAEIGRDGSLHVRFGDGQRGARPATGEIRVRARYRTGGGRKPRPRH